MINSDITSTLTVEALWHFRQAAEVTGTVHREGVQSVDFHPHVGTDFHANVDEIISARKKERDNREVNNSEQQEQQQQQQEDSSEVIPLITDAELMHSVAGRLCTVGLDGIVRIWELLGNVERCVQRAYTERGAASHDHSFLRFISALERTNLKDDCFSGYTCRFSPCGQLIASTYSDGVCIVWANDHSYKVKEDAAGGGGGGGGSGSSTGGEEGVEKWKEVNLFRGLEADIVTDVVDVQFTPDSSHIIFVGASGYTIMYQIRDGTAAKLHKFASPEAHKPSALGVAVDPFGLFFATTGTDKRIQFYDMTMLTKETNSASLDWKLNKNTTAGKTGGLVRTDLPKMFLDNAIIGGSSGPFFRRSSWSPDGALAAFPYGDHKVFETNDSKAAKSAATTAAGEDAKTLANAADAAAGMTGAAAAAASSSADGEHQQQQQQKKLPGVLSSVILVLRHNLSQPAVGLTLRDASHIRGCRFAPKVFEPYPDDVADPERAANKGSWGPLLYRYAIAVWTANTVIVYTSDCSARHSSFSNLHYAPINDAAWAPHCKLLCVASDDMTLSVVSFADTLGTLLPFRTLKENLEGLKRPVPPLVACVVEMQAAMQKVSQDNEGLVVRKVNKTSGGSGGTNTKVTAKRRTRDTKKDGGENKPPAPQPQQDGGATAAAAASEEEAMKKKAQEDADELLKLADSA